LQVHWDLISIELDQDIVNLASEYFALNTNQIDIRIGNGLSLCCTNEDGTVTNTSSTEIEFNANSFDFIVLDVDSKDTSVGMSCPPAAFVERTYLQTLSLLLKESLGILAINVSARDPAVFQHVCENVESVFPHLLLSQKNTDVEEDGGDLNVVLLASHCCEHPKRLTLRDLSQHLDKLDDVLLSDLLSRWESYSTIKKKGTAGRGEADVQNNSHDSKKRSKKKGKKKR
jgi:hypothetical protein